MIEVGFQFKLDVHDVVVGECVQLDLRPKAPEMTDLTEPMVHARPGGRFWTLLESEDEEQVECHAPTVTTVT